MKLVRKLLASPRVGHCWVRALESASQQDYEAALVDLDFLDEFYRGKNIEYHLLRSLVHYGLGDDVEAARNAEVSIDLLRSTKRYNPDEKKYLRNYGVILGRKAIRSDPDLVDAEPFSKTDLLMVNLANVRQSLKTSFPLRDHPDWD